MIELFPKRELGVLLHPSSLCNSELMGTIGDSAYSFVDWLQSTGSTIWQILPLSPNGKYASPYFSPSSFCGNPWLIDLENLSKAGLLDSTEIPPQPNDHKVSFRKLHEGKEPLLFKAAANFLSSQGHPWQSEFRAFCDKHEWIDDTALFYILQSSFKGKPWWEWPRKARLQHPDFLQGVRKEKSIDLNRRKALFFFFEKQWADLHAYAKSKNIRIVGDLPIYVDENSAEVWLNQRFFKLDREGQMTVVSGVPPDAFSTTGQLWGNPIYDWDAIKEDDFSWWRARLRRVLELTDIVRIDHFRGLSAYWEIPVGSPDATKGKWVQGPGQKFFDAIRKDYDKMPIIVEDLGTIDDDVIQLRDRNNFFGMRILQFAFDDGDPDNLYLPHCYSENCFAYLGNHDNPTTATWWENLPEKMKIAVAYYFKIGRSRNIHDVVWTMLEEVTASPARVVVHPLQDLLVLGKAHRMNDPSTFVGNWRWRMPLNSLTEELAQSLLKLKKRYRD